MERNLHPEADDHEDSPRPAKRKRTQFGLKELASGVNPDVDIVAIHGIDGDRDYSWTADNGVVWLKDLLPEKLPNARILTYGYDANTHGQEQLATEYMHGHAMTFISKLALFREETSVSIPVIQKSAILTKMYKDDQSSYLFVAHSSGGILLKSALIHSYLSNDHHLRHHHAISDSTYGVAFFSTPHQGSEVARFLVDIASSSMPTSNILLRNIDKDSETLQHQLAQYSAISAHYETKFFYELYDTPVAGRVSKRVVPKSSAIVPGAVNAEAIGIGKDHVNMVKYRSADDEDFRTVSTILSLMAKAAPKKLMDKRSHYKSTRGDSIIAPEIDLTPSQQRALSKLPRVQAARFNAESRPTCLKGTRVDLLKTITEWTEKEASEGRQIFWLCGQAGTGKTTISSTVAGDCQMKHRLGASFFFCHERADLSELQPVFTTLAYQLGIFHKSFQVPLAKAIEEDPDIALMEPGYQFRKLIVDPLRSCDSFPTSAIVVLDALDECRDSNPISKLLSILLAHIHELPQLKFFVTSRPEVQIREGFQPLRIRTQAFILHDIEASIVNADIDHYLRHRFSIAQSRYPEIVTSDWPPDESIKSLVRQSGKLFIFAATAMNFILDCNYDDPPSQLAILLGKSLVAETPSSPSALLDQLYLRVLRQAFPLGTTLLPRINLLKVILGAIVLLRNPLSPGALETLLGLQTGRVRNILRRLHSVIVVPDTDEHPIRLIHPSFFDFITTRCSDVDFQINPFIHHEQLATMCLKQMNGLKRNICEIENQSKLNNEIEDLAKRVEWYISPAMQYACLHWSFHLCGAGGNTLQGMLEGFLHGQVLYWIEALSLLGYLREGIHHLKGISKLFNTFSTPSEDLLEALDDVTRFMADLFEPISCASLQLYRSALPLLPPSSFLHKTFHHELDGGMRVLQGKWLEKYPFLTILRGQKEWITSIDVSPDKKLIVASSVNEVRLWDLDTGTSLQTLSRGTNQLLLCARFSPDGNRVIAGTYSNIIFIWNFTTGAHLQTIRLAGIDLKTDWNRSLAFSPDCESVVGSNGNDIFLWTTSNGDLLRTFSGHSDTVLSVAFSPDQLMIASGSQDHTIRIWSANNGAALSTLRGHSNWVAAIAFSPDSKYIISGSHDNDLIFWDASRGIPLRTLKEHTTFGQAIAFSPDGTCVISGSRDGTLRILDAISGEMLKSIKFRGGFDAVGLLADSKQYIWSANKVIYIWDANYASNFINTEQTHIWDPRFSPGGTYIYEDALPKVNLWDGTTGTHLRSLRSDLSSFLSKRGIEFPSITFSSDDTRIVLSLSVGQEIWDVASGNMLFTINALTNDNFRTSFSDDGRQVITDNGRYDLPPRVRPSATLSVIVPLEQIQYSLKGEWVFASNGTKEERCVWIPPDWRGGPLNNSYSHGRVTFGSSRGLVLLDLSRICLAI